MPNAKEQGCFLRKMKEKVKKQRCGKEGPNKNYFLTLWALYSFSQWTKPVFLKPDQTNRFDQLNCESVMTPVQLEAKTGTE